MRSVVFTRPPRLQLVPSVLSVAYALKARHLNSPRLAFQTHVGCVTIVWFTLVEEQEKIGTMLNRPRQQRTSRFQSDSRPLRSPIPVTLALAIGKSFGHNLAVPTMSQKATMLGSRSDFRTIRLYPMKSKSIRALAGCGCTTPFDGIG